MSIESRLQQPRFESPSQQAVVSLLVASALVLQRMNELLRGHGITHDQYNVLRILRGAHPEGHPRVEVGRRMVSRAPDVTRLLDRLARQGLIERGWSRENRRLSVARITPDGLALLATVDPALHALQQELTQGVSAADLRVMAKVCDRLAR
jgi:DNA-binding MarR family transcriptional regulator